MKVGVRLKGEKELQSLLRRYGKQAQPELKEAARDICTAWKRAAAHRAPVGLTGALRNSILTDVSAGRGVVRGEVGSNQTYAPFVEFGTRWIAGGQVAALGTGPDVTDAQAVRLWPAKDADRQGDSPQLAAARSARGSADEQMPWLRPAFNSIRAWAVKRLIQALQLPGR